MTRSPLYFGWYVLAAVTFIAFVNTGTRSSFGIFVIPMSEEFGWNRFTISVAAAIGAIVGGVAQPFIGHVFDRLGARNKIGGLLSDWGIAYASGVKSIASRIRSKGTFATSFTSATAPAPGASNQHMHRDSSGR